MDDVYRQLRKKLDMYPIGFPESDEAYAILQVLFTPEEAEFALKLPMMDMKLDDIAASLGEGPDEVRKRLDAMADRGTVFVAVRDDIRYYRLLPSVVGFSETPFWPGKETDKTQKLAPLWRRYFFDKFGREIGDRAQSIMRIIPLNETISNEAQVTPYDDLTRLLERNEYFAVAHCPCRLYMKGTGQECDHSLEVCLHFDDEGRYMVEHGMAREITREETLQLLKKCNEEGLVHSTYNMKGKVYTICNCCSCCCVFFKAMKELKLPGAFARSNYVSYIDPDLCSACEVCADRCPVEAITVDEYAVVDEERCVGCGVCVPACPTEAIVLIGRPEEAMVELPDRKTWVVDLLKEKGVL
ncbi:MAG: 4Fe-4S binding protein [Deltaproteobacteria bacterium]|nr:4Fe-4S binding protein [Deltaproteobacteria bacterium]